MTVATRPGHLGAAFEAALARVDEIADRTFAGWHVPGLIYGVVRDGELIHSRGVGTLRSRPVVMGARPTRATGLPSPILLSLVRRGGRSPFNPWLARYMCRRRC